jgi:hypothetical protein
MVRGRVVAETLLQERGGFAADNPADLSERPVVFGLLVAIVGALRSAFRPRASLVSENLALRQQLAV